MGKKIERIKRNGLVRGIYDTCYVGGFFTSVPYIVPTAIRKFKEEDTGPDVKEDYKGQGAAIALGFTGSLATVSGQVLAYISAVNNGYPEALGIPLATNLGSLLYEGGRKKIEKIRKKRAEQRAGLHTLEEKLSLSERIFGKKKTTLSINPSVTVHPKINVYVNDEKQNDVRVEIEDDKKEKNAEQILDYIIKKEPFYLSVNGEKELFATAYKQKLPVMLKGPTGCGKTRFIENMAYHLGKPLITVNCQEDLSASDLAGRILLNNEGTYWQDGPLALSARYGAICYLDEVIEARNDAMVLIHSLTDHRRILPIDKTGEVIKAHPGFMLVISYNPHYQSALKDMKQSTRQRFIAMDFDYPPKNQEVKIIQKETGVNEDIAERLVNFGHKVRGMKGQGLSEGASTRLLIYAGNLINSGIDYQNAIEAAIIQPITDERDLQRSIMDVARTI